MRRPARIFVVEDEALIAMELQDRLERMGHVVCGYAARAEAAMRDIPAAAPDLILMDINLGPGMTGIEVANSLRGELDAPFIFVTAYSNVELASSANLPGSDPSVAKPFRADQLQEAIERALPPRSS